MFIVVVGGRWPEECRCLQTGIRACVAGGKLVVVGLGGEEANLPIAAAACKEIDIIGSFRYANTVSSSCFVHPLSRPPSCLSVTLLARVRSTRSA